MRLIGILSSAAILPIVLAGVVFSSPGDVLFIPGGDFWMGDHHGVDSPGDEPVHFVHLDPFYMGQYEVMSIEYCEYLNGAYLDGRLRVEENGVVYPIDGDIPYCDTLQYIEHSRISWDSTSERFEVLPEVKWDHPVTNVSWFGAVAYCNWKSAQDGYQSCYDLSTWECDFTKNGFRLPTEAEWEYAARGGLTYCRFPWGDTIDGSKANYVGSGDPFEVGPWPHTTRVGYYDGGQIPAGTDMANGYGLYDVAGNLWEWCHDWWGLDYYSESVYDNPSGPDSGDRRVLRGGSWFRDVAKCEVAYRGYSDPTDRYLGYGFRIVRSFSSQQLQVNTISAPLDPVQVGTEIEVGATFLDPDSDDGHAAMWDWGDGSTSPGIVDEEAQTVSGSHVYTAAGVYTLTLTVTDADGASDTGVFEYVVVYDQSAGFVTGGGWIDSPEGAYKPDPSSTGKANFGFVSKYKNGATIPMGQTEFAFKAGNLNFHSSSYDWLVVTGSDYARFKGTGTINGSGEYKFMLWAGDGEPDTFRIKIWEEDEGSVETVVYDNGFDQAIEGGSIVIHTDKAGKN